MKTDDWKIAQKSVAEFLEKHYFGTKEEVSLKSGKRMDILAQRKIGNEVLHVIVEVKNWQNVTRKKESDFCKQIIDYLIEYAMEEALRKESSDKWHKSSKKIRDKFLGILVLTKDAHFTYRKVSQHFFAKNKHIQGIPFREQIAGNILLYVSRFDYLSKVFEDFGFPLYQEPSILNWF
ncbi:MAG: hypothetical protein HZR80_12375 [Candidatus Heimdallarchaeota archaeon]